MSFLRDKWPFSLLFNKFEIVISIAVLLSIRLKIQLQGELNLPRSCIYELPEICPKFGPFTVEFGCPKMG